MQVLSLRSNNIFVVQYIHVVYGSSNQLYTVKQESDINDVIKTSTRCSKRQSEIRYNVIKAKYTSLVTSLVFFLQYDIALLSCDNLYP